MAFVVLKPFPAQFRAGDLMSSTEEMGWLGMCPVVVTMEEALALTGGNDECILEIHSPSELQTYRKWRINNADET